MRVLKLQTFDTLRNLPIFINNEKIEQSDIQDIITSLNGTTSLLYWVNV